MTQPLAIGLDGGATRLRWHVQGPGREAQGERPGVIQHLHGWPALEAALGAAIDDALQAAGAGKERLTYLGLGLAGIDAEGEITRLRRWARRVCPNLHGLWVGNDALAALRLGAGRLAGIVLCAGTGSICLGVGADGRRLRAGGWGPLIGDPGSAYAIGRAVLERLARHSDGLLEATPAMSAVREHLGVTDAAGLRAWLLGMPTEARPRAVAELARVAVENGEADAWFAGVLDREADALAELAVAVQRRMAHAAPADLARRTVILSGGMMAWLTASTAAVEGTGLRERVLRRCETGTRVESLQGSAARGALQLGRETPPDADE